MTRQKHLRKVPNGFPNKAPRRNRKRHARRGVVAAMFAVLLPVICAFLAYGVDTSMIAMERNRLQNAVDAAALAASQEIVACVEDAAAEGSSGQEAQQDINSIASESARSVAVEVAALNGVSIDGEMDITFGKRVCQEQTSSSGTAETWPIEWNKTPYNTVGVTAKKTFPLIFGSFVGKPKMTLQASAAAFVEARDIVVVLDFSGSMCYDSQLRQDSIRKLGQPAIEDNLRDIYDALQLEDKVGDMPKEPTYMTLEGADPTKGSEPKIFVTFKDKEIYVESSKDLSNVVLGLSDGTEYKYDSLSCGQTGTFDSPNGSRIERCWIKSGNNPSGDGPGYGERFENSISNVKTFLGLDGLDYPYPRGSWNGFIKYCRKTNNNIAKAGYRNMYGGTLLCNYHLESYREHYKTPDHWMAPQYPFQAVKNGCTLFLDFLDGLEFGDDCGIVSYDTNARFEDYISEADNQDGNHGIIEWVEGEIDLTADPICGEYAKLDTIQRHKQAGHYDVFTGIGAGLKKAKEGLQQHRRYGARPTILLMTDGNANKYASDFTSIYDAIPGFDWADWTDYDEDGDADYSTGNRSKQYAFYEAISAVESGYTIHTMSVGANADRSFMKAIAFVGGGEWIDVPGGVTIAEMDDQMLAAFSRIASNVPPPKLVYEVEEAEVVE